MKEPQQVSTDMGARITMQQTRVAQAESVLTTQKQHLAGLVRELATMYDGPVIIGGTTYKICQRGDSYFLRRS